MVARGAEGGSQDSTQPPSHLGPPTTRTMGLPRGAAVRFTGWHGPDSGRGWQVSPPRRCACSLALRTLGTRNPSIGERGGCSQGSVGWNPRLLIQGGRIGGYGYGEPGWSPACSCSLFWRMMGRGPRPSDPRKTFSTATSDSRYCCGPDDGAAPPVPIRDQYTLHRMSRVRPDSSRGGCYCFSPRGTPCVGLPPV